MEIALHNCRSRLLRNGNSGTKPIGSRVNLAQYAGIEARASAWPKQRAHSARGRRDLSREPGPVVAEARPRFGDGSCECVTDPVYNARRRPPCPMRRAAEDQSRSRRSGARSPRHRYRCGRAPAHGARRCDGTLLFRAPFSDQYCAWRSLDWLRFVGLMPFPQLRACGLLSAPKLAPKCRWIKGLRPK
ncbi:hypothetical protein ACVWZ4_000708 [Bradyrhizobium sp. USDA 4472]